MKGAAFVVAAVVASAAVFACSSSDSSSSSTGGTAPTSTATSSTPTTDVDSGVAADNCVSKGETGNDKGVGAYCDSQTQCPAGKSLLCTTLGGDSVPKNKIFCTLLCTDSSTCGTDAYCDTSNGAGSGCVPNKCGNPPAADGGSADGG